METRKLLEAKRLLQGRIQTLENDAKRAFTHMDGLAPAPLPILLYGMSTIEFLSGLWAGWHEVSRKPSSDPRTPLRRGSDFLEAYLLYPRKESHLILSLWKKKLFESAFCGRLKEADLVFSWVICPETSRHWTLEESQQGSYELRIGIFNLVRDLRDGLFGPSGLLEDLRIDHRVQSNWETAMVELEQQSLRFEV